jgi:chemotaxis signal transduction protein
MEALRQSEHQAGSYITFRAGSAHYALSVYHVRYITALESISTRTAPDRDGRPPQQVFDYEGDAIPLYRFNHSIGANSQTDESKELIELLMARRQDHVDWIDALEHSLLSGEPFSKAKDPHKCAFGLWYDAFEANDAELREILARFDSPHKRIHSLAERLLNMAENGREDEAKRILDEERYTTLKELMGLFAQATTRLEDIAKPVVLVLEASGRTFALEVENLGDMQEFTEEHWLPDQSSSQLEGCYDGFFQAQGEGLFLNLVPARFLNTSNI